MRRQADEHRHHALHDDLTGLPNRRSLYERLDAEMAAAGPDDGFSLLLVDLDRFKEVNDVLGHQSGDDLLCQVAARFAGEVRTADLLARLGGDEFAVLVGGSRGAEAGLELARRLSGVLCREFILSGVPVHVEASIGIARYPVDGRDATALLRCADSAMYAAKDLSTELELFDGKRDHHSPTRLKRLGELRQALDRDELLLHYQPKLRLENRTIPGVEALVRWHASPSRAAAAGRVRPAGRADGAHQAADELRAAPRARAGRRLAARRLRPLDRRERVRAQPARSRLPGRGGSAAAATPASRPPAWSSRSRKARSWPTRSARPRCSAASTPLGVALSLDDFGTGYSSLSRLRELPISEIKIDRSFSAHIETDERDMAIMRSTIELGHNLGCSVVAEGLETAEALERVTSLGCDTGQGFHIARPLDAEAITAWLADRQG